MIIFYLCLKCLRCFSIFGIINSWNWMEYLNFKYVFGLVFWRNIFEKSVISNAQKIRGFLTSSCEFWKWFRVEIRKLSRIWIFFSRESFMYEIVNWFSLARCWMLFHNTPSFPPAIWKINLRWFDERTDSACARLHQQNLFNNFKANVSSIRKNTSYLLAFVK